MNRNWNSMIREPGSAEPEKSLYIEGVLPNEVLLGPLATKKLVRFRAFRKLALKSMLLFSITRVLFCFSRQCIILIQQGTRSMHVFILILSAVLLSSPAQSGQAQLEQSRVKRLVLKDGSYELIQQYEIKGDRVRYFSSERHAWEEIPAAEVDWPATKKYASDSASDSRERAVTAAKARVEDDARSPLVSAGIRLPSSGGVFLLDVFQGKPELDPLLQNGADVHKNMKGNILRAVINPIASSRQTIELKGDHATVQSHETSPSIYVAIDATGDPPAPYTVESAKDHLRIVRCEQKKGNRVVGMINIAIYGKVKQEADYIEARVESVSGPWVRVTPASPLAPGEYAMVEVLGKEGMNEFVWDFGVNPAAPPNPGALGAAADREKPVLLSKPKKP